VAFYSNALERMRITDSGSVGIGTSAPKTNLQISNVSGADLLSLGISDYQAWVGGKIDLQGIASFGADMTFYTHAANSSNNATVVERMRIKSNGTVGIGITTGTYNGRFCVEGDGATTSNVHLEMSTDANRSYIASANRTFIANAPLSIEASVTVIGAGVSASPASAATSLTLYSTTSTAFSSSLYCLNSSSVNCMLVRGDGYGYLLASAWAYGSDLRMKENISDVENGIDMVLKMKPKHFDYIDGTKDNIGFIAQDIQEIIPQAISVPDEATGMLALKTDFLVPYLVKAIQELNERLNKAGL
jgi:hypothetical protein